MLKKLSLEELKLKVDLHELENRVTEFTFPYALNYGNQFKEILDNAENADDKELLKKLRQFSLSAGLCQMNWEEYVSSGRKDLCSNSAVLENELKNSITAERFSSIHVFSSLEGNRSHFHLDQHEGETIILCLKGTKKIRICSPAAASVLVPSAHIALSPILDIPVPDHSFEEITLNTFECCLLPAGHWHEVEALENSISLSFRRPGGDLLWLLHNLFPVNAYTALLSQQDVKAVRDVVKKLKAKILDPVYPTRVLWEDFKKEVTLLSGSTGLEKRPERAVKIESWYIPYKMMRARKLLLRKNTSTKDLPRAVRLHKLLHSL